MSIYKDNSMVYPTQNWLPQSGLLANNKSLVFNVPTAEQPVIPNAPTTKRVAEIKGAVNSAFMSDKLKEANRVKARTEAGMAQPSRPASNNVPPPSTKGLSTIGAANIATGISTAANVASSIYGAIQASKMKPTLSSYQAPIESALISDNTNAIQSAGKENIDKSINTARANNQRNGLVGMDGILLAKENEGLNQLSANLEQNRLSMDYANAQIQNQTNQYNQSNEANRNQFNAQTQNNFEQYKSGIISMGAKNANDSLQSGVESIFGNMMAGNQMKLSSITSEMSSILQQMQGKDPVMIDPKLRTRLQKLQLQKGQLENSIFKA